MENVAAENIIHEPVFKTDKGLKFKLKRIFFVEKLYNTTGLILLIAAGVLIALGTAFMGIPFGVMFLMGVMALPILYWIIAYPVFGMIVQLVMAYLLFQIFQFDIDIAVGTLMDGMQVLLLLGMMIKIKKDKNLDLFKSPITIVIFIWLGYNLLEVGNPVADSKMAWLYTIRSIAIVAGSYFVAMYGIRSVKDMRAIFVALLILSLIGAAYGFKQEYIGFTDHELIYLNTPGIADLLFIQGHWRKYSIFSDPVAFAYNMVMPCIFLICLFFLQLKWWVKILIIAAIFFMLDAMLFSGTRGANVLLPAALLLLAVLKFNRRILMFSCVAAVGLAVLIVMPTSNPNIVRFQTAFKPNNDDSYNLRKRNQKKIQPYILAHPFGGGLGATGVWGQRFSPNSYLASFPPDSGYIRVAVEEGWIGLLVFCTYMFVIMRTGINNYHLIEDRELKTYCLAMTLIVFAYNLANFPQEALVQYPSSILFYVEAALINVTLRLDIQKREEREKQLALQQVT